MADLVYRCAPRNSCERTAEAARSEVTSISQRVTALESDVNDLDTRVTALEGVSESPFVVVDTEAELDAALLLGKHILIRGEGNEGEIELTSPKTIGVDGTRIWGYGFVKNSSDHYSAIRLAHSTPPSAGTKKDGFNVEASDVEVAGMEMYGTAPIDDSVDGYFMFQFSSSVNTARCNLHGLRIHHVNRAFSKQGSSVSPYTEDLNIERCFVHSFHGLAFAFQYGMQSPRFLNNRIIPILSSDTHLGTNTKGIWMSSKVKDALIQGNFIDGTLHEGIELTSTVSATATVFDPMHQNKTIGNTIRNTGVGGISYGFATDGVISDNILENIVARAIESSAGSVLGQSSGKHTNLISNNFIRGVTSGGECYGISCDKSYGDLVIGNRIFDIQGVDAGSTGTQARGIFVYDAKHAFIDGNHLEGVDGCGVYVLSSALSNLLGQHSIQNNVFRSLSTNTKAQFAVYVFDTIAAVRNNLAWDYGGTTQRFYANNNSPAVVYPGDDSVAVVSSANFLESNIRITY